MPAPLPSPIRVEAIRDDVTYTLPVRPLGKLRWLGLFPVAFGVVFVSVPTAGLIRILNGIIAGRSGVGEFGFAVFLIPFVVAGLVPLGLGLLVLSGRCRVDWRQKRLSALDFVGPVRWRRRMPKSPVRKLSVSFGGAKVNDKPVTSGPLADLGALTVEFDQGKPRVLALGYPRDWLQALAEDLSVRVGATAPTVAAPDVELVNMTANEPPPVEVVQKPPDSQVRVEARPKGILLVIPPTGFRKGSRALFGFGVLWCLFMGVFTVVAGFAGGQNSGRTPPGAWVFIGVFWLIGLGMLAGALNMARRRAMLLVENGRLAVAQAGLFGSKRWDWQRNDIAAIRVDASGMEVNNVPVIELQIHSANGKKVGFFAGRDQQELRWMAAELRRALNVPAKNS